MEKSKHQEINVEHDRHLYIGGSDLPTILGFTEQYGTSVIQFAREKLKISPRTFTGNEYTRYGQIMEPMVRDYINEVYKYNFKEDSIIDSDRMYRGNCDGLDNEKKVLLEIKTYGTTLPIKQYEPQCQFYMELFDIDECLLVGYKRPKNFYSGVDYKLESDLKYFDAEFDPSNIAVFKLRRDKEMFSKIEIEIEKFKYLLDALRKEKILDERKLEQFII